MKRWRAVIFDLDGTLTDSAPAIARALNAVWRELGRPEAPFEAVRGYIGDGPRRLIERARRALDLPEDARAVADELDAFMRAYKAGGPGGDPYPDAHAVLAELQAMGAPMTVCTNKPQAAAESLLQALDFAPYLLGVVGGDTPPKQKPDRAHVEAALALLPAIPISEVVMVGDGMQDVTAAEAAGVDVVVAAYGYGGAADRRPDLPAIQKLADLPGLLARTGQEVIESPP